MLIFVSGILVIINKQTVTPLELIIAINLFLIAIPGVTFGYYMSLLLIPLFLLTQENSFIVQSSKMLSKVWICFYLFFLLALPAWPISWGYLGLFKNYAWQYYGVQWAFAHLILSLVCIHFFILLSYRRTTNPSNKT